MAKSQRDRTAYVSSLAFAGAQHTKHCRSQMTVGNRWCRSGYLSSQQAGSYLCSLAEPRGRFWAWLSASRVWCNNVGHGSVTGANSPICFLWRKKKISSWLGSRMLPGSPSSSTAYLQFACLLRKLGTSVNSLYMHL